MTIQDLATGQLWLVGRQLLAGSSGGLERMTAFYEHLGCTLCDAFYARVARQGPWVLEPPGVLLKGASSAYTNARPDFTCHKHAIRGWPNGTYQVESGREGGDYPGDGTWSQALYDCGEAGCAVFASPPPPSSQPPPSSAPSSAPSPPPSSPSLPPPHSATCDLAEGELERRCRCEHAWSALATVPTGDVLLTCEDS